MKIEEFGKENETIAVMLHGANFVHSFGMQYRLADRIHMIVPHIMGFGNEANRTFETEACVKELAEYIKSLGKKVHLIGFSLGSQLAFKLVCDYEELFSSAIFVSPWLIKDPDFMAHITQENLKQLRLLKKRPLCHIIGLMNGLIPSDLRREFVEQMQCVKEESLQNAVDNGITLENAPQFAQVSIPMIALAGEKEQAEILNGIKKLAEINPNCKCEIWPKARHNIPPMFSKRFNELICSFLGEKNEG